MKQLSLSRMVAVACILCAGSAGASAAQTSKHNGDPARWYKGDSTEQQRMQVLRKELSAAYAQQQAACKHQSASKRSSCLKEARANYQRDSANARQLVANAPQSSVTERIVSTTPAGGANGTQAGATAYGSSGTGSTGASSGQSQSGTQQSGASGYSNSGSMGASGSMGTSQSTGTTGSMNGNMNNRDDTQSAAGASGSSGSSGTGTGYGQPQSAAPINGATQSGSSNMNGSQSGTSNQSMGAGTGATQSDTQGQSGTGTAPPVQR